jgi:hypothetical protein
MPLLMMVLWLAATSTVLPKNTILVPGALPSASDASTPVPEDGRVGDGRYRNAYFGLTYPIPAGWTQQPAGPPPSEAGGYVLTSFALMDGEHVRAHVLLTAQDLFFAPFTAVNAKEVTTRMRGSVPARFEFEMGPAEVTIGGRTFYRLAYRSPRTGLHWRALTTDARCHSLTFTFTGMDVEALDASEKALANLALTATGPACVFDYAKDNVVAKTPPDFHQRYNTIPVRLIIDTQGNVKHAHLLSAFPEQSQAILVALREWRFKPYVVDGKAVEVETGIVFGLPMGGMQGTH